MREVAVFDFDGTLAKGDSFLGFARHALTPWRIARAAVKASPAIIGWKLGRVSNSRAKEKLFAGLYGGLSAEELRMKAEAFEPAFKPEVLRRLLDHLEKGHTVYIITASLDLWMEPIARRLGVGLCCTRTAVDSHGHVCPRFASPNCHGPEKLKRLLEAEPDRESYHLTVYGDSDGDADLLAAADCPVDLRVGGFEFFD